MHETTLRTGQFSETYRIFDTLIDSDIALPELPVCRDGTPRLAIRRIEHCQHDLDGFVTRHEWLDVDGRLMCRVARRGDDYLLLLPCQASFLVGSTGVIHCGISAANDEGLARQLLLSQVLPRYLAHIGELVLHASAVELPDGRTVAFVGASGRGKSTLAAYCHQHGGRLIDDDCILLRCESQRICVTGGAPTLRLYPDSLHALGHDPAAFIPCANHSQKRQMCLREQSLPDPQPCVLDALFLLEEPRDSLVREEPRIERARGQGAVMAILGSAFHLDPADPIAMERTFRNTAQLLAGGLPVYHLHYHREHAQLPHVLRALQEFSGG